MIREIPERLYWGITIHGNNPLLFKENNNDFSIVKEGVTPTSIIDEVRSHFDFVRNMRRLKVIKSNYGKDSRRLHT